MSTSVPEPLQKDTIEARLLKQKIWDQINKHNQHFIGVVVGPEGSGKSYTGLKIGEVVDPTFSAERVMFDPAQFLARLQEWKENNETQGKAVVGDEAGVGVGVRTWYEEDQIKFNQVLQVIRDENMAIIFTVPRLAEMDSQTRGRVRGFMEMVDKDAGEWARFKYLNWKPTRDDRDDIYRKYPELRVGGYTRKVRKLCVGPPSDELVRNYERRKSKFQQELYQDTYEATLDEEPDEPLTPDEVVEKAKAKGIDKFISWHGGKHHWYLDKDMIRAKFGLSHSTAMEAKKLLANDPDVDIEEAAADRESPHQ